MKKDQKTRMMDNFTIFIIQKLRRIGQQIHLLYKLWIFNFYEFSFFQEPTDLVCLELVSQAAEKDALNKFLERSFHTSNRFCTLFRSWYPSFSDMWSLFLHGSFSWHTGLYTVHKGWDLEDDCTEVDLSVSLYLQFPATVNFSFYAKLLNKPL